MSAGGRSQVGANLRNNQVDANSNDGGAMTYLVSPRKIQCSSELEDAKAPVEAAAANNDFQSTYLLVINFSNFIFNAIISDSYYFEAAARHLLALVVATAEVEISGFNLCETVSTFVHNRCYEFFYMV